MYMHFCVCLCVEGKEEKEKNANKQKNLIVGETARTSHTTRGTHTPTFIAISTSTYESLSMSGGGKFLLYPFDESSAILDGAGR
eukprot:m.34973 g.34973  ORF g.34973 m.34973 type:complete len:84 (+) comp11082_c0_seq1:30-281(+)